MQYLGIGRVKEYRCKLCNQTFWSNEKGLEMHEKNDCPMFEDQRREAFTKKTGIILKPGKLVEAYMKPRKRRIGR